MNTARIKRIFLDNFSNFAVLIELLIIFILFGILTQGLFLTPVNISNLIMQGSTYALLSIGMLFILVSGNIDLSCGALLGFTGTIAAVMEVRMSVDIHSFWIMLAVIAVSMLAGLWNGFWVAYGGIPAFIVTLSSQLVFKGATYMIGQGASIGPMDDFFCAIGRNFLPKLFVGDDAPLNDTTLILGGLIVVLAALSILHSRRQKEKNGLEVAPLYKDMLKIVGITVVIMALCLILSLYRGLSLAVILLAVFVFLFSFMAQNTAFGKHIYAVGGNRESAELSGVDVKKTTMGIFLLMGFLTGVASIVYLGRVAQASALAGVNFEFNAITGCIVGGASTLGGVGRVTGAVVGALLMAGIDNGMSLCNVPSNVQYFVKGLVLLAAVALDMFMKRRRAAAV